MDAFTIWKKLGNRKYPNAALFLPEFCPGDLKLAEICRPEQGYAAGG